MTKKFSIVAILLVLMVGTALGSNLYDEQWFLIEENGIPIGTIKEQLSPTETGYHYSAKVQMYLDLFGEIINYVDQLEIIFNKEFALVSASEISGINDITTHHNIVIDYSGEYPTAVRTFTDFEGSIEKEKFQFEPETVIYYLDTFIHKILAEDGFIPGNEYIGLFLESEDFIPIENRIIIGDNQSYPLFGTEIEVNKITVYQDDFFFDTLFSPKFGTITSTSDLSPELVIRKATQADVEELAEDQMVIGFFISPMNLDIVHPYRTTRSVIEVVGSNLDQTQICDNRQQTLSMEPGDDHDQIVIEINRDRTDYANQFTLPIVDPSLEKYLASDQYIMPDLPEIQAITAEVLGNETDAWRSVQTLTNWVFNFIEAKTTFTNLTTSQILELETGDSSEYAILFASLARSAGIPTRIAVGFRGTNNGWLAHMWNEVWLGQWISIDPNHNQTAPDALLVKLFESADASNLNAIENDIISNVSLRLRLYEAPYLGAKNPDRPLETEIIDQTYFNHDFISSFTIPPTWDFIEASSSGLAAIDPTQMANVILEFISLPAEVDIQYIMDLQLASLPAAFAEEGFTIYGPEAPQPIMISGLEGSRSTWGLEYEGLILYQELILVKVADMSYSIIYTIPAMYHEYYQDDYQKILESFMIYL